jgi:glycosyltransferase involved in cell wall biosynthesis
MHACPTSPGVLMAHPSSELYGADRVMLETVEGLVQQGSKVVVTLPQTGPLVAELEARGASVSLCPSPVLRKSSANPLGLLLLGVEAAKASIHGLRLIRRTSPDVIYVSTLTIPLWLLLARISRLPVLTHVHEAEKSAKWPIRMGIVAPLILADRIIANSRYSAETLTDTLPALANKVRVVYNGVVGPDRVTAPREAVVGTLRMVYVGRLSPRKGVDVAIAGVAEARRRGIEVSLDLVGAVYAGYEWYEEELLSLVASLRMEEHIRFLGFCTDVWPNLARADVAIVPSRLDEPFGNTAVEALLAARLLIVSDTSGLREAAGNYAAPIFVPADDPNAVADAIELLHRGWRDYRRRALEDSLVAEERHRPSTYRSRVSQEIKETAATKKSSKRKAGPGTRT